MNAAGDGRQTIKCGTRKEESAPDATSGPEDRNWKTRRANRGVIESEPKWMSRKAARVWRQPLDCGGLTPLFLRMVEGALRRALPKRARIAYRQCFAASPHDISCPSRGKPKRRQAGAVQSLAALTRLSQPANKGSLAPLSITPKRGNAEKNCRHGTSGHRPASSFRIPRSPVPQRLDRVQLRGFHRGEEAGEDAHRHAEAKREQHAFHRDDGRVFTW